MKSNLIKLMQRQCLLELECVDHKSWDTTADMTSSKILSWVGGLLHKIDIISNIVDVIQYIFYIIPLR